jgi:hypothetical protein
VESSIEISLALQDQGPKDPAVEEHHSLHLKSTQERNGEVLKKVVDRQAEQERALEGINMQLGKITELLSARARKDAARDRREQEREPSAISMLWA